MNEDQDGERNIYNSAREELMENGEISAEEDAFMSGYDEADSEEEDTSHDAYEQAFKTRRRKRKAQVEDPFEEEDPDEEEID